MKLGDIIDEYEKHGRISQRSMQRLRECLLGTDPYEAITVATDCAAFDLAPEISQLLDSHDPMVRWNAIGSLHTRFRLPNGIEKTLELALHDESSLVRAIALVGLGELLPKIKDRSLQHKIAYFLTSILKSEESFDDLRAAAYEGVLAAMDVLPLSRPPAHKPLRIPQDVDPKLVKDFGHRYLEKEK